MTLGELKFAILYKCRKIKETGSNSDTFIVFVLCTLYDYMGGREDVIKIFKSSGLLDSLPTYRARNNFIKIYGEYHRAVYTYLVLKDYFRKWGDKINNSIDNESILKISDKFDREIKKLEPLHIRMKSELKIEEKKIDIAVKIPSKDVLIVPVRLDGKQYVSDALVTIICYVCNDTINSGMMQVVEQIRSWDKIKDDERIWYFINQ